MNAPSSNPWLLRWGSSKPNVRVLCVPFAGGSATNFSSWSHALPPDVEICGVQFPGRQKRIGEQPVRRVEVVVEPIAGAVLALPPAPLLLFGDCTGAFVAFELARRLRAEEHHVEHLIISCCRAPHLPYRQSPIHDLPVPALKEKISELQMVPPWLLQNERAFLDFLPVIRADFELAERYIFTPAPPLSCAITVLAGTNDVYTPSVDAEAWVEQTTAAFRTRFFDASHNLSITHRSLLIEELSRIIAEGTA